MLKYVFGLMVTLLMVMGGASQALAGTPAGCKWIGTAPACNAKPYHCVRSKMLYKKSSKKGDGKTCTSGEKVLCCPPPKYHIDPANWMKDKFHVLKRKTLAELTLPGTHDSGCYQMAAADGFWKKIGLPLAKNISTTQEKNVYQQLLGGIRYFDLRPYLYKNELYIHHNQVIGSRLSKVLMDIRRFVDASGRKELIILDFDHFGPSYTGDFRKKFSEVLKGGLGAYIHNSSVSYNTTLEQILNGSKSKVVIISTKSLTGVKYTSRASKLGGSYTNTTNYTTMYKDQHKKLRDRSMDKLHRLYWTLTPPNGTVSQVKAVLPANYPKQLSQKINPLLEKFVDANICRKAANSKKVRPNVIYVDYFDWSNVVAVAWKLNGLTGTCEILQP